MALVAALPLEGVQARLGEEGRTLVMLARGHAPPSIATFVPSDAPAVELDLEALDPSGDGATTLDELVFALRTACLRLCAPFAARGLGIGELEVRLEPRERRSPTVRLVVRPARPEIDVQALFELARATLEGALRPHPRDADREPMAVTKLCLTATSLVPARHTSESLPFSQEHLGTQQHLGGSSSRAGGATLLPLQVALARLRGRFGGDRIVTPIRHEDPRPEHRGRFVRAEDRVAERATQPPNTGWPAPTLRERLRVPSPAIGVVVLSRMPSTGDRWPLEARNGRGPSERARTVREISPPERVVGGWWSEPFELVYHWLVADDGTRALFARTPSNFREGTSFQQTLPGGLPAELPAGLPAGEQAPDRFDGLRLVAIAD